MSDEEQTGELHRPWLPRKMSHLPFRAKLLGRRFKIVRYKGQKPDLTYLVFERYASNLKITDQRIMNYMVQLKKTFNVNQMYNVLTNSLSPYLRTSVNFFSCTAGEQIGTHARLFRKLDEKFRENVNIVR